MALRIEIINLLKGAYGQHNGARSEQNYRPAVLLRTDWLPVLVTHESLLQPKYPMKET